MLIDTPVCILGAGPQGLATLLHLHRVDPELARQSIVIDSGGGWMSNWCRHFERLEIDTLRSPSVHHPSPDVDALVRFVAKRGLPASGLRYGQPVASSFRAFVDGLIHDAALAAPRREEPHRIVALSDGRLCVETNASQIVASRVVVATNPHRREIPDWVWPLCGGGGDVTHADDVDLRAFGDLTGERVTVVGGGLTAAHLAIGAARRGASVDLIARRRLEVRSFDTDPGWLGPKYLDDYERCGDPFERHRQAKAARGGGTMPEHMRESLERPEIRIHEAVEVAGATTGTPGFALRLSDGSLVAADRLWLATGTRPELSALRCVDELLPDLPTVGGLPFTGDDLGVGPFPLHITGRLAAITLGPAAGNLWGARQAARRITRAITGVDVEMMSELLDDERVGETPA